MKIGIEHHETSFNVTLASKEGVQPFLTIKGCRIVEGSKGPFVSWPAKKMESGKYWNHVYASEAFSSAVMDEVNKTKPKQAKAAKRPAEDETEIPF